MDKATAPHIALLVEQRWATYKLITLLSRLGVQEAVHYSLLNITAYVFRVNDVKH
jgi:hypothetical protein